MSTHSYDCFRTVEVEGNGKKMKGKASSPVELEAAIAQAKAFIEP